MEKEYIMDVAQTIKSQLFGTTEISVLMSWGIEKFIATEYKDMPALKFKVNGRLFTGIVLIALNGSDYYEIYRGLYVNNQDGMRQLGRIETNRVS